MYVHAGKDSKRTLECTFGTCYMLAIYMKLFVACAAKEKVSPSKASSFILCAFGLFQNEFSCSYAGKVHIRMHGQKFPVDQ